jgi:multimeric flavodoxin WrbA
MRITILNGDPESGSAFDTYVQRMAVCMADAGHDVTTFDLRSLDLKGCSGCLGCWVKTPGECAKRDDSARICRAAIQASLLVFASPVAMGFTSALLKGAVEQMIPLLHPFIVMEGGECHHRARYAAYPALALLLGPAADSDAEDLAITTAMWTRTARNLKTRLVQTAVADRTPSEVADAFVAAA